MARLFISHHQPRRCEKRGRAVILFARRYPSAKESPRYVPGRAGHALAGASFSGADRRVRDRRQSPPARLVVPPLAAIPVLALPISDHITSESQQLRVKIALFYALGMRSIRCGSSLATLHASLRTFARISSPASRHTSSVPALRADGQRRKPTRCNSNIPTLQCRCLELSLIISCLFPPRFSASEKHSLLGLV